MHRWDVYRGRRTGSGRLPAILLFLLALLLVIGATLFFALPSYLVYSKDSVQLQLPGFSREEEEEEVQWEILVEQTPAPDYSDVTAEIVVQEPDYSNLHLATGADLGIVQSVYVPYAQANEEGINAAVTQCKALDVKGLTIELKDGSGQLLWLSETNTAVGYALNGTWDLSATVAELKEMGYYLTAEIACCVDNSLVSRNANLALKDAGGYPYSDVYGAWMDPWNAEVRQYTIELASELMTMGFDEVLLSRVEHPNSEVQYTRSMSGTLTREACVTNFAIAVREGLADVMAETGAHLSVEMTSDAFNNENVDNGQRLEYLLGVFDRVYTFTETYQEVYAFTGLGVDSTERFVPIISWTFPGASWANNYFSIQ